jgi:uncharacterized protein YPO0396
MLSLTKIFLHNWHRFDHKLIEVQDSLYLAGANGTGKSSVLDALQVVLVADLQKVRFNSSAQQSQERSERTLDTYVRGKIGEDRWLRPGNTVGYIALEFATADRATCLTIGVCLEAGEGKGSSGDRTYFILPEALDVNVFAPQQRALARRELKNTLKARRGARSFDQVSEYVDEMLNRFGGLNPRFGELFLRALAFQPIRNIGEFVERWLLREKPLDVVTLREVKERLDALNLAAQEVKAKLAALATILACQAEIKRWRERHAEYLVLTALLRVAALERRIQSLQAEHSATVTQLKAAQQELNDIQAALNGALTALVEARVQLQQSDVIRRRDELLRLRAEAAQQAQEITARWAELRRALQREAQALQPLLAPITHSSHLSHNSYALDETTANALRQLLSDIAALNETPPPASFLASLDAALPVLKDALAQAREAQFGLRQQSQTLIEQGNELEREIKALQQTGRATYRPEVERLRELLTPLTSSRPPLLCELIEVADERWQDAVEAMLGARRFIVIVAPVLFERALRVLDEARERERLYEASLLDLAKAREQSRAAQAGSLALQVKTDDEWLRAYLDSVLGDIITCATVNELRQHRRAVTPEVVAYGEWAVRAIRPQNYRPWFIGARALRSQLEARERELENIRAQLLALQPQMRAMDERVQRLEHVYEFDKLRQRLDAPLDARLYQQQAAECEAALQSLDLSGVAALEAEVTRLDAVVKQNEAGQRRCLERQAVLHSREQTLVSQLQDAKRRFGEVAQQADETRAQHPSAILTAESLRDERLTPNVTTEQVEEFVRNADITARRFETQADNEQKNYVHSATTYNTRYQFAGETFDAASDSYANESQRLNATELPKYETQIAEEQRRAELQLREHVLHQLRENILLAEQELERINDALRQLEFHGKRYRFISRKNEAYQHYHELIMSAARLGTASLFESEFYQQHQGAFDDFYRQLTQTSGAQELERLTDYRHYLSYDIEVLHSDGQRSQLSKLMGHTSGGETQTPFYLTIAASFLQLYQVGETPRRGQRPTIRLVAFDEAFSKMDQQHIGSTLELFQKFNLQIITATPLERCEYLVPKICTSLVLTTVQDSVLIEPYRNYAARLTEWHEHEEAVAHAG